MSAFGGPEISDSNLLLYFDPANPKCYAGTGTTLVDLSGNGITGTLVNGPVFNYQSGGSFYLDGSDDRIDISNTLLNFGTGNFSVDFWYYHQTYPNAWDIFFETGGQGLQLGFSGSNTTVIFYSITGNTDTVGYAHGMTLGSWYHLAFTRIGGLLTVYVNGASIGSTSGKTGSFSPVSGTTAHIGKYTGGSAELLLGRLGPFRVYKGYGLTQADVLQYYNATRLRFQTPTEVKAGLILDLDAGNAASYSGSGSTWTDLSGSGYNATISGSPTFTSSGSGSYFTINNGVTNQYMQASVPKPNLPVTLSFWAYPLNATASYVALFDTAPYTQNVFRLYSGSVEWWNADPAVAVTPSISSNNWYNFVFIYDYTGNRKVSFYLNGRFIATGTGSTTSTYAWSTFVIGNVNGSSGGVFSGRVAKAAIYNRALSAVEIGTNFDALRGRYGL